MLKQVRFLTQDLTDGLLAMFEQNIEFFKRANMPDLAAFEHYTPKEVINFFHLQNGVVNFEHGGSIFYPSENPLDYVQNQVLEYIDNDRGRYSYTKYEKEHDFYGHIHYRYLNECATLLENYLKDNANDKDRGVVTIPHCLMLGIGLGYGLTELISSVEICHLTLIEPDDDIFFASLFCLDYESVCNYFKDNNVRFNIITQKNIPAALSHIYKDLSYNGKFLSGFSRAFVHYSSDSIKAIVQDLLKYFKNIYAMMGFYDDHLFGISHGIHSIQEGRGYILNKKMKNASSLPVFIVGNGPSLDNDIAFLRRNQDKALIVAAGSAIDTLYSAGVQVDFYVAIERTNDITQILKHIDPEYIDKVTLLATDVVNPVTCRFFKQSALFMKNDEPLYELLSANGVDLKALSSVTYVNPLVSNLALSAMLELGFLHIYLFGIDNGKKTVYSSVHSQYSKAYGGEYYGQIEFDSVYTPDSMAEGNFGGMVETNYLYKKSVYNLENTLEQYIKESRDISCINCSDGAKIEHTKPKRSSELDFNAHKDLNKAQIIKDFLADNVKVLSIGKEQLESLLDVNGFNQTVDTLLNVIKTEDITDRASAIKALIEQSRTLYECKLSGCNVSRLLDGSLQYFFICMAQGLFTIRHERDALEIFQQMLERYKYFLSDAKKLYAYMPDYIQNEHLKILKGKLGFDHENSKAPATIDSYELDFKGHGYDSFKKRYE